MQYSIKARNHRGQVDILHEFDAPTHPQAKELFTDWLASHLITLPGLHHVRFSPLENGQVLDESDPLWPDTPAIDCPAWFTKEGIYDAENQLILPYQYPDSGDIQYLESFEYSGLRYYLEKSRLWTSMEVCATMRITRRTLLRWVKNGHIVPVQNRENPSTRKHLFADREVMRVLSDLPPSSPLSRKVEAPS